MGDVVYGPQMSLAARLESYKIAVENGDNLDDFSHSEIKRMRKALRKEADRSNKYKNISGPQRKNLLKVQERLREVVGLPVDKAEIEENWDQFPEEACQTILEKLDVQYRHNTLQDSHGPESGFEQLNSVLTRATKYQEKFIPQEVSLLHKVWWICKGDFSDVAVLDIGGGNACMCLFASMILDCYSVCIDYVCPPEELCGELYLSEEDRERLFKRITCDVRDVDFESLFEVLHARGKKRIVILAKHLCGCGTDLALTFAKEFQQYCSRKGFFWIFLKSGSGACAIKKPNLSNGGDILVDWLELKKDESMIQSSEHAAQPQGAPPLEQLFGCFLRSSAGAFCPVCSFCFCW